MNKRLYIFFVFTIVATGKLFAQETLPDITVKNINGSIIVSWKNGYTKPVATINIQRSYDSLRNYSTIGSVLNPQATENGYSDTKPPYNKMYYRVFISFEGGSYLFSKSVRPVKDVPPAVVETTKDTVTMETVLTKDSNGVITTITRPKFIIPEIILQPKQTLPEINANTEIITYPSRRIFTGKDNNIILNLPDAATRKYHVKFFDENDAFLFELNKITEDFLIIEKVNFVHAGWYHFEIIANEKVIEKNKFYVPKDGKNQTVPKDK